MFKQLFPWAIGLSLALITLWYCPCSAQFPTLAKGMDAYRQENYEEAIEILSVARKEDPNSSPAAFFLGLAYKQTMEYELAAMHLQDAAKLTPKIKEALVELVDVLLILSRPEDLYRAQSLIHTAEKEAIMPDRTAFLKARLLQKQGEPLAAVAAYQQAKALNPELAQACDYQIGLIHLEQKAYRQAQTAFQQAIRHNPEADIAIFARAYHDLLGNRLWSTRPARATLTVFGEYDTNMILKPTDDVAAEGIADEKGFSATGALKLEFVPQLQGPFNLYMRYAGLLNLHQHHATTHDVIGNSLAFQPGYNFGKVDVGLKVLYDHYLRRNPNYEAYLDQWTVGPQLKTIIAGAHYLEAFAGYRRKAYADDPTEADENRDADIFWAKLDWIWLSSHRLLISGRYEFNFDDTAGPNWEHLGNRLAADMIVSFGDSLKVQLGVDGYWQHFSHAHTILDKKREDRTHAAKIGVIWDISRHFSLMAQYLRTRCNSNIGLYDYTRNQASIGVEARF